MNKEKIGVTDRPRSKSLAAIKTNPFSKFALALYSSPGIEETSIELQDRIGAKVNLLLWCLWLETIDIQLSTKALNQAEKKIYLLDNNIVYRLRVIRREFKLQQGSTNDSQKLYQLIKQLEVLAEFQVIELLWQLAKKFTAQTSGLVKGINLNLYLQTLGDQKAGEAFIAASNKVIASMNKNSHSKST